jgi:hypothetical protein
LGAAIIVTTAVCILTDGLQTTSSVSDPVVGSISAILGTLAYASAKHRRLYQPRFLWFWWTFEIACLWCVCFPRVPRTLWRTAGGRLNYAWSIHPVTTIVIPVLSLGAYAWVNKTKSVPKPTEW